MSNEYSNFTQQQLGFLQLWHIAAQHDCLYIIDWHCFDLFEHDKVSALSDEDRDRLVLAAQPHIFHKAIENGYRPGDSHLFQGGEDGPLC